MHKDHQNRRIIYLEFVNGSIRLIQCSLITIFEMDETVLY